MKLLRTGIATLALALALGGCAWVGDHPANLDDSERTAAQIYRQAQLAIGRGDFEGAIERYEELQSRYPFDQYAKQAQLDLLHVYYNAKQMDEVIAAADRFIRLNPTHPRVDYAYYMRASANLDRGDDLLSEIFETDRALRDPTPLRQAFADFSRLVTEYPNSRYAEDALYRMRVIKNQLARHELNVARFYLDESAYVAAVGRAKTVIEDYQGTPSVREALEVLAAAYEQLEMPELRQDVLRIIRLNYPDHPLAQANP